MKFDSIATQMQEIVVMLQRWYLAVIVIAAIVHTLKRPTASTEQYARFNQSEKERYDLQEFIGISIAANIFQWLLRWTAWDYRCMFQSSPF
jgi:hypothetical protein